MFQIQRFDPSKVAVSNRQENDSKNAATLLVDKAQLLSKSTSSNAKKKRRKGSAMEAGNTSGDQSSNKSDIVVTEEKKQEKESNVSPDFSTTQQKEEVEGRVTTTTLRVVAPEQPPAMSSSASRRKRILGRNSSNNNDEAMDDFDVNEEEEEADATWKEIEYALHMSKLPILEAANIFKLPNFLIDNLKHDGFSHFFPIQCLIIPDVIATERRATHLRTRDVCCAAPTGSGKTLAFAIPILQALSNRIVTRLAALVVLPSRDLATQVYGVFQRYSRGSNLRIGLAIGQTDFLEEQKSLVIGNSIHHFVHGSAHLFQPLDIASALAAFDGSTEHHPNFRRKFNIQSSLGGSSAVDILICTPGRLVDHLDKTPGFTLQHLRFLVIDEADRLLNQSYQGWIGRVCRAANIKSDPRFQESFQCQNLLLESEDYTSIAIDPITWRKDESNALAPSIPRAVPLRKLLFSATLTKDPQKLAACGLVHPKHYDARHLVADEVTSSNHLQQHYSLPELLEEFTVDCAAEQKPLVTLALVLDEQLGVAVGKSESDNLTLDDNDDSCVVVIFTASLETTHRLARLMQLLWARAGYGKASEVAEFSSALNQKQRDKLLQRCSDGSVLVIVCSDGMSRGMDIPKLSLVINYDIPSYAKTYVHRCGRTARAGRKGKAISLISRGDEKKFNRMRELIENSHIVKKGGVNKTVVNEAVSAYPWCASKLQDIIGAEKNGLDPLIPIGDEWIESGDEENGESNSDTDSYDEFYGT